MTKPKKTAQKRVKRPVPKDPAEKIRSLPKELLKYYELLKPLVERLVQNTLLINYQIGEIVIEAEADLDTRAKKAPSLRQFADHHVQFLAEAAGVNKRTLSECKRVAREYTREEYQKLISNSSVTWPHVVHLLNAKGQTLRREMEKRVASEGLSAQQLQAEIRARQGNQRPGTGRPLNAPNNLNEAFFKLQTDTSKLTRSIEEVWFGPRFSITVEIGKCPADEVDAEIRSQIDQSLSVLDEAADAVRTAKRELQQAQERLGASPIES